MKYFKKEKEEREYCTFKMLFIHLFTLRLPLVAGGGTVYKYLNEIVTLVLVNHW